MKTQSETQTLSANIGAAERGHRPTGASSHVEGIEDVETASLINALLTCNIDAVLLLRWMNADLTSCPIVYANEQFERLTGYCLHDLATDAPLGRRPVWSTMFETPALSRNVRLALENGQPDRMEVTLVAKDGRRLNLESTVVPIMGKDGQAGFIMVVLRELAVLDRADAPAVEEDLRQILASARCLVWHALVEDREGEMLWDFGTADNPGARTWLPVAGHINEKYFPAFAKSVHPADRPKMDQRCREAVQNGELGYSHEFRCRLETGVYRWVSEDVHIDEVGENCWRMVGVVTDISQQKRAEEKVAEEKNLLRTLIDTIPDCIYIKDSATRYSLMNGMNAVAIGAHTPEKAIGKTEFDFMPEEVAEIHHADDLTVIETGASVLNKEETVQLPSGKRIWRSSTKVPLRDADGAIVGLIGIARDVSTLKRLEIERERLMSDALERAERDPLTGLWNHRAFQKRLKDEAELALANKTSIAIIVLDLDNFKFFNDSYGHTIGDEVLCEVADALNKACRAGDMVARFGGDEFAVLMPLQDAQIARVRAWQISNALKEFGYQPPAHDSVVPIKLSLGVAVFPDEAKGRLEALALADERLLRAKSGLCEAGELAERLTADLAATFPGFAVLNGLVTSVDKKDRYTRRHSENVLLYASEIAQELQLDMETYHQVQMAALVHDVGKIGVADSILRKPASLTAEEFEAIKLHPTIGAIMVNAVPGFEAVLPGVKYHHECWDGGGYPEGLVGADIPLMARILAVADGYSAMTTDRPYRRAMSSEIAVEILREGAGTQWDPVVVDAFLTVRCRQQR